MSTQEYVKVGNTVTKALYNESTRLWYVDLDLQVYSGATIEELGETIRSSGQEFKRYRSPEGNRLIETGFTPSDLDGKKVQFHLKQSDVWLHPEDALNGPMRDLRGFGVFSVAPDALGYCLDIEITDSPTSFKQIMLSKRGASRIQRHSQDATADFLIPAEVGDG